MSDVATDFLVRALRIPSVSGNEKAFTEFVADFAEHHGLEVDLFQSSEKELELYELSRARHIPLKNRPTLVIKLPGTGGGKSILFNAHADVVSTGDESLWSHNPWSGDIADGNVYGRGACDVKGPLASAIAAMIELKHNRPAGDVLLEVIPGEEDCVGLGTLTSLARGYRADACLVLEPTENLPRCASRGGCRFEITAIGRSVHGTVKWLGEDAIDTARKILNALKLIESDWNDRTDDPLFSIYPIARPLTVDTIKGGTWQGMLADRCTIAGYMELLPLDDRELYQRKLKSELARHLASHKSDPQAWSLPTTTYHHALDDFHIIFSEDYAGHRLAPDHILCQSALRATAQIAPNSWTKWTAFNSGCEAGLRAAHEQTPTLVWGPGSLQQAHAPDEFVSLAEVQLGARLFKRFALHWCV
jgi:acetylornithine deacetylase